MKRIKTYKTFEDKKQIEATSTKKDDGTPLTKEQINKIPFFYHATDKRNYINIMSKGIKKSKMEGAIFLADSFEHAAIFLAFRGVPIVVFKVDASKLNMSKMHESFDHSFEFFKCRAFAYIGDISPDAIDMENIMQYNTDK
jgi:hypothetical protein